MTRPGFLEGVGVALGAALIGGPLYYLLPAVFGHALAQFALIAGLGLGYLVYLLWRSPERSGRLVVSLAWLTVTASAWLLLADPLSFMAAQIGMIWLVRALYHQPGPLAAVLDLALNLLALVAGLSAYLHSGSAALGIWSFFLVPALFVVIPAARRDGERTPDTTADPKMDRFQHAYRIAEIALRKLSTRH